MSVTRPAASAMRQTMDGQAEALARILHDPEPAFQVAERLRARRVLAIGTGTSWHAASQAAALLRAAGLDASAAQSADAVVDGPLPGQDGALLAFAHTGATGYTARAIQFARGRGAQIVQISGLGVEGADLTTVQQERSSAYTASHLGAVLRATQLAPTPRISAGWARCHRPSRTPTARRGTTVRPRPPG
jgi:glucosamine--fructose-6-phosphate aminotransferase (isomerizing)